MCSSLIKMAKAKKMNKASKKKGKARGGRRRAPRSLGLDAAAAAYARLIADPCNAALVHPIYPGSAAGFLFRAESFFGVGTNTGETAGYVHWTPGYVNANNTELLIGNSNSGAGAAAATPNASSPGKTFLGANAKGVRCIAACMKVTFAGTESARSGRIHYGQTQSGMIDNGQTITADGVAQTLQNFSRTPTDTVEIVWKPEIGDTEFNDPTEAAGALIKDRKGALTFAFAGLPTAVGFTVHLTAVYEWTPAVSGGIGHNTNGKPLSSNSLDDVLTTLQRAGVSFVHGAATAAMSGAARGVVNTVASVFGNMPAQRRIRGGSFRDEL